MTTFYSSVSKIIDEDTVAIQDSIRYKGFKTDKVKFAGKKAIELYSKLGRGEKFPFTIIKRDLDCHIAVLIKPLD